MTNPERTSTFGEMEASPFVRLSSVPREPTGARMTTTQSPPSLPLERHRIVTVRAADGPGLVADIAAAVFEAGGNIVDVGQYSDLESQGFGCRLEIESSTDRHDLEESLSRLAGRRDLQWYLHDDEVLPRVVIACSSTLHCVSDLLARVAIGSLRCEVVAVVSDRLAAQEITERHGVPFVHVPVGEDRREQEAAFAEVLEALGPDLVILARYMRILPQDITDAWRGRMINIHHSFLPAFAGAGPYARAYERGVKLIGATAHYVTEGLDEGPIIVQDVERVSHRDRLEDLVRRGADVERGVLAAAVRLHLEHRVMVFGNRTCVFD